MLIWSGMTSAGMRSSKVIGPFGHQEQMMDDPPHLKFQPVEEVLGRDKALFSTKIAPIFLSPALFW